MKSCKSLQALKEYFISKENSELEVREDLEIHDHDNPLNFFSDMLNTKSFSNKLHRG